MGPKPSRPQSKTMLLAPLPMPSSEAKLALEKDKQAKIFKDLLMRTVSNLNKSNSRTRVTDHIPSKSPSRYLSIDQSQQRPAKAQSFSHKRSLSHTHNNSQSEFQNPYSIP